MSPSGYQCPHGRPAAGCSECVLIPVAPDETIVSKDLLNTLHAESDRLRAIIASMRASSPQCETCRFWTPDRDWQDERWGDCVRLSNPHADDVAGVWVQTSGEEPLIGFTCPASFGCTEHTLRPSEDSTP